MWRIRGLIPVATAIAAGLAGFFLGARRTELAEPTSSRELARTDLVDFRESFSELENTKAQLDTLTAELVVDIRSTLRGAAGSPESGVGRGSHPTRVQEMIRFLEQAITELAGTDRQPVLIGELLPLLEAAGRNDEWVDRYLALVYLNPAHPVVGRFTSDALQLGLLTGRRSEVMAALRVAESIPVSLGHGSGTRQGLRPPPTVEAAGDVGISGDRVISGGPAARLSPPPSA